MKPYEERVEWKRKEDEQLSLNLGNLRTELKKNKKIIDENKELLPSSCRNIESVKTILGKLTRGRAETIEEAMNMK